MIFCLKSFLFTHIERLKFNFSKSILVEGLIYTSNFGDYLNYPLVEFLSGKSVVSPKFLKNMTGKDCLRYSVIGSIIHFIPKKTVVWGSGLIADDVKFHRDLDVRGVRGPLTREILMKAGVECPEVYGDPALLLPLFYYPSITRKYRIGVLPHQIDRHSPFLKLFEDRSDAKVFDINCGRRYRDLVKEILRCDYLVTSSLHGIIVASAYKVPYVWVNFSNTLIGGEFKFQDFFLSVGKANESPIQLSDKTTIEYLETKIDSTPNSINLPSLIASCPFIDSNIERKLLKRFNSKF